MNRVKQTCGLTLISLGLFGGFKISIGSFNNEEFVEVATILNQNNREIAAIKKDLGLSSLGDHLLISTSPLRSLLAARLERTSQYFSIILGHFSTKDTKGDAVFACQLYDKVTLTYESFLGSQSPPQSMILEMGCHMADNDVKHLAPLNFAPESILKEPAGDGIFQFSEKGEFTVHFQNIDQQWARKWNFKGVKFSNSKSGITPKEISILDVPVENRTALNMDWTQITN